MSNSNSVLFANERGFLRNKGTESYASYVEGYTYRVSDWDEEKKEYVEVGPEQRYYVSDFTFTTRFGETVVIDDDEMLYNLYDALTQHIAACRAADEQYGEEEK